jgi:RNA polymerase sigma factor (sigma-70 family)
MRIGNGEPKRTLVRPCHEMKRSAEQIYDELLVLRARDGDEAAFAELFSRWNGRLTGHAFRLTGRADAAHDAVQDTWLAIVRGLGRLDDPARFPGFAHRILTRRCADWTRGVIRQRRAHGEYQSAASGDGGAETASDLERVREALARISVARRVVVTLHYLNELSVAEIAALLRVPAGTVKSRLHDAREQLRSALQGRKTPCPSSKT